MVPPPSRLHAISKVRRIASGPTPDFVPFNNAKTSKHRSRLRISYEWKHKWLLCRVDVCSATVSIVQMLDELARQGRPVGSILAESLAVGAL